MSNVIVTGFALFAMFFGAGNLIFPPMLGRAAGPEYVFSIFGFVAAGVGLPLMGILAVARKNGGIEDISRPLGGFVSKAITIGIIYGGLIYLGSTSSLIVGTIRHTDLLYAIAKDLFGATGKVVLGVATFLACLTTAIGLIAVCGEYFDKLTGGRFKYKTACIVFSAISVIFANAGVDVIIKVAAPLLMTIYPTVIVMVVLAIIGKMANVRVIWIAAVSGAFVAGLVDSFYLAGIERQFCDHILGHIPLGRLGFGWIVPSLVLGLAAVVLHFFRNSPPKKNVG